MKNVNYLYSFKVGDTVQILKGKYKSCYGKIKEIIKDNFFSWDGELVYNDSFAKVSIIEGDSDELINCHIDDGYHGDSEINKIVLN